MVVKQEVPGASGFDEKTFELGDIGYDMPVFNFSKGGFIYGGGVAGSIPSATDDTLGTDKWTLGPEVILATMKPWGVVGLILSHQWDVGGAGNEYVESPDALGPQHQLRLQITPEIKLPR